MNCNELNRHERDASLSFDEATHTYRLGTRQLSSVTTLVDGLFPQFDVEYWSERKAPAMGMTPEQLRRLWEQRAEAARRRGTEMHARIEQYYLGNDQGDDQDGYHLFLQFASQVRLSPYRTEWRIYDEDHGVAGTLDMLERDAAGDYNIYDWKRSTKLVRDGVLVTRNNYGETGTGAFSAVPDTSYWHYALQLSTYRFILERKYGIRVRDMKLGVFHPDNARPYLVTVPYLQRQVEQMLQDHIRQEQMLS